MKAPIFTFIFCIAFSAVSAQWRFGVRVAGNFSNLKSDLDLGYSPELDNRYKLGYAFGIEAEYKIDSKLAVAADLQYSDKGYEFYLEKSHYDYLNIPLLGRYHLSEKLSFDAGIGLGMLVFVDESGRYDWLTRNDFNNANFDAVVGMNYMFLKSIAASIRYEYGLTNIMGKDAQLYAYPGDGDPIISETNMRKLGGKDYHRNFQFGLVYFLRRFGEDGVK